MALKFTVESFLNVVRQSRLIDPERLDRLVADLPVEGDSQAVADALVAADALTTWQADKLLKGKHKGFFLGKYRLQALLGKGGMSSVYLAEHVLMRRRCAIKVLPHKKVNDTSYLERFHREAQAVASLDHPNIVRAYDVDREVDGTAEIHFLVMEYVEGQSLQELMADQKQLAFRVVADYVRQSAHGLSHAHDAGLVHRDIKPGNLLVDMEGVVKILDLGLARFFEEGDENPITLRHDEKVLGTADYLAPEQALDSHMVDARADIYSLGCTMYFLLTGQPPFNEGTLAQRLMWHQTKDPVPVTTTRPDMPAELDAIVSRMMAKQRDDRFQTARDVAAALAEWLGESPGGDTAERASIPVAPPVAPTVASPAVPVPQAEPSVGKPVVPPIAKPVESPTPAVGTGLPGQPAAGDTNHLGASETDPIMPAGDEPELANFLAQLGSGDAAPAHSPDVGSDHPAAAPAESAGPVGTPDLSTQSRPVAPVARPVAGPLPGGDDEKPVGSEVTGLPEEPQFPDFTRIADDPTEVPADVPSQVATQSEPGGFPGIDMSDSPSSGSGRTRTRARRSSSRRRRSEPAGGKGLKVGAIVGAAIALIAIVAVVLLNTGGGPDAVDGDGTAPQAGGSGGGQNGAASGGGPTGGIAQQAGGDVSSSKAVARATLEVGPDAEFKTISAALNYLRDNREAYRPRSRRVQASIKVLGGQVYAESIELDGNKTTWPPGIEIVSTGVEPAIIAAPGDKPGIKLTQVEYVRVVGFRIQAKGKSQGVVLAGAQDRVQLENLVIEGFTAAGIEGLGAAGEPSQDALRLKGIRLHAGAGVAVGIKLAEGVYDTANLEIRGCRLIGPQKIGIQFTDNASSVVLAGNVIQQAQDAIVLSGANKTWKGLTIRNNTLAQVGRGMVFEHLPTENSDNVTIRKNLFFEVDGPECLVEKDYDELKFSQMVSTANAITDNWSTRKQPADLKKSERELMLPGLDRQRGVTVEFSSTDPAAADFLEPRAGTLPRGESGTPADPRFVGAQPFRSR